MPATFWATMRDRLNDTRVELLTQVHQTVYCYGVSEVWEPFRGRF